MTDGQDNCSQKKLDWMQDWFQKNGLKSTFLTICNGDNPTNQRIAKLLHSKYLKAGNQQWFSNSFDGTQIRAGFDYLAE